jgi:hypothetical protein
MWGAFSDEKTGLSFSFALGPGQRSHSRGPSPAGLTIIFYSFKFKSSPTWKERSPYVYPLGSDWPSYSPQDVGSLFIASYGSQSYG